MAMTRRPKMERHKTLETIVRELLTEMFPDAYVDKVVVKSTFDSDGDPVLDITVVLEEGRSPLDKEKLLGFVRHLKTRLLAAKCKEFPLLSFVSRREANRLKIESA